VCLEHIRPGGRDFGGIPKRDDLSRMSLDKRAPSRTTDFQSVEFAAFPATDWKSVVRVEGRTRTFSSRNSTARRARHPALPDQNLSQTSPPEEFSSETQSSTEFRGNARRQNLVLPDRITPYRHWPVGGSSLVGGSSTAPRPRRSRSVRPFPIFRPQRFRT
jgi:hypothetical protein